MTGTKERGYVKERTCHIEDMETGKKLDYQETPEHIKHCNSCNAEFGFVCYSEDGDTSMDIQPNYCPNCGAKVVEE